MATVCCILNGGPELEIQVNGVRYKFEDHPYCGPTILNRRGEPASVQPTQFLRAASLWAQQGRKLEDGLCVWYHKPEPILEHLAGKHFMITGYAEAVRGG